MSNLLQKLGIVALGAALCLLCSCKLVLGIDSHTAGGCTDSPCESFAVQLAEALPWYTVVNTGVGGGMIANYGCGNHYELIADHVLDATYQIIGGSNDAAMGWPAAVYERCLDNFISRLIDDGVYRIVLLTPPPANGMTPERSQLLVEYREVVLETCSTNDRIECGPDLWTFLGPGHFGDGATHMNQAGHDAVADALIDFYESGAL
jgi:hypothetical protein